MKRRSLWDKITGLFNRKRFCSEYYQLGNYGVIEKPYDLYRKWLEEIMNCKRRNQMLENFHKKVIYENCKRTDQEWAEWAKKNLVGKAEPFVDEDSGRKYYFLMVDDDDFRKLKRIYLDKCAINKE